MISNLASSRLAKNLTMQVEMRNETGIQNLRTVYWDRVRRSPKKFGCPKDLTWDKNPWDT